MPETAAEAQPTSSVRAQPSAGAGRVTEDEDRATGAVRWPVYRDYIRALVGDQGSAPIFLLGTLLISVIVVAILPVTQRIWFARFADHELAASAQHAVLIYGAIGLAVLVCSVMQRFLWLYRAAAAGRTIHDQALSGVLGAPLRFFDSTPTGRILNRFARDLEVVDDELSWSIEQACRTAANLLATLLLILSVRADAARDRAAGVRCVRPRAARLPACSARGETARVDRALAAVRAVQRACDRPRRDPRLRARALLSWSSFYSILEHYQRMHWCNIRLNRWFGVRMGLIGGVLSLATCLAIVLLAYWGSMSTGTAGLVLSYSLGLWGALNWAVRALSEVENYMTQAERLQHYARLPRRARHHRASVARERGLAHARRSSSFATSPPATRRIYRRSSTASRFAWRAGSKVGLVGRTGAGKSTLSQALFRFLPIERGQIRVDGIDVASIRRWRACDARLRSSPKTRRCSPAASARTWIASPAAATSRSGRRCAACTSTRTWPRCPARSMRPSPSTATTSRKASASCCAWAALCSCGAESIVLDEATASVDVRTDRLIQETVRSEFRDVTVLVIAHRLDTIADADQIVELSRGRVLRSTPSNANNAHPARRSERVGPYN